MIKAEEEKPRPGFKRPACWYVNFTSHALVAMPQTPNGAPTDKEHILSRGLANLKVPLDIGTFRKLKEASEGARRPNYCVDVVFNPFVIKLFMDDGFCKTMEQFRPWLTSLAFKNIEQDLKRRLSQSSVTLVKSTFYKDGLGRKGQEPREFLDLPGTGIDDVEEMRAAQADVKYKSGDQASDSGFTLKTSKDAEPTADGKPLIEECSGGAGDTFAPPARKKGPAVKKGFLNNTAGKLYGEEGSREGVLPENAGDPLGYLPKKLRQTCKVVDCNAPDYQKAEEQRKSAERQNTQADEFNKEMRSNLSKWEQPDRWQEDSPIGDDEPKNPKKRYDNDYSRFADLEEEPDEPAQPETRDWYYDEKGNYRKRSTSSSTSPPAAAGREEGASPSKASGKPAVKKGFLKDTKGSIYGEEGSSQGGAALDPEKQKEAIAQLSRSMLSSDNDEARKLAEMLATDGKPEEAAAKMAEVLGKVPAARKPAAAGENSGAAKEDAFDPQAMLPEMMKLLGGKEGEGLGGEEGMQKVLSGMMDMMNGDKAAGGGKENPEAQMRKIQELFGNLQLGGSDDGPVSRPDGVDAPDRADSGAAQLDRPSGGPPNHRVENADGALKLTVEVPGLGSMQGVGLDVAERLATLSFPDGTGLETLRAELPSAVVPSAAKAKFSKKTKTLTVTMPLA